MLAMESWLAWNWLHRAGWAQAHKDQPVPTFRTPWTKTFTATSGLVCMLFKIYFYSHVCGMSLCIHVYVNAGAL